MVKIKRIRILFGLDFWTDLNATSNKETEDLYKNIEEQMENRDFKTFKVGKTIYVKSNIKFIELIEE